MNYSLHPEAVQDLRDAALFYREQAGNTLSQSFLAEFEQSVSIARGVADLAARSSRQASKPSLRGSMSSRTIRS